MSSYVQIRSFPPKIDPPHVNFSNFQAEENFFIFQNFWDVSDEKRAAKTPLIDQVC